VTTPGVLNVQQTLDRLQAQYDYLAGRGNTLSLQEVADALGIMQQIILIRLTVAEGKIGNLNEALTKTIQRLEQE